MSFLALIKAQFQQKGRYKENERFLSDLIQDVLKAIGILSNLVYALGSGSLLTGSQICLLINTINTNTILELNPFNDISQRLKPSNPRPSFLSTLD